MIRRILLLVTLLAAVAIPAHAQLSVTLEIKRRLHLRYEPILATVRVQNLSGRDIMLHDEEQPWFGFDVAGVNADVIVPPRNPDYRLDPLELKMGETVKRTVDLTRLYGISEFGMHRIKATIFAKQLNRLFVSQPQLIDISEGKTIWQQRVGVPDTLENAGRSHLVSLIEFQDEKRYLYVRVEDEEKAYVYCTRRLGHLIDGTVPQVQLDTTNSLYVLHLVGPKTYTLSNIGVNGEFISQHIYIAPKTKPYLRRIADGSIQIVGARRQEAVPKGSVASGNPPPKISDRPAGLPRD